MAAILVDYENVGNAGGLKGAEYLNAEDILYIFYSQCCSKIRAEYMNAIEKSGCDLKIYRLVNNGKNALDFYLASECGTVAGNGERQIAIISRDKGFTAIVDFFKIRWAQEQITVVTAPDIASGLMLLNAPEDTARRTMLHQKARMLDLAEENVRYTERNAMKAKIRAVLAGTEHEGKLASVLECVNANTEVPPKKLYTDTLHRFGRNDGTAIYRMLRRIK